LKLHQDSHRKRKKEKEKTLRFVYGRIERRRCPIHCSMDGSKHIINLLECSEEQVSMAVPATDS